MFEIFYVFAFVGKMKSNSEPQLLCLVFYFPMNLEQWLLSECRISKKIISLKVQFSYAIKRMK